MSSHCHELHQLVARYARSNWTCPPALQAPVLQKLQSQVDCSSNGRRIDWAASGVGGEAACRDTLALRWSASLFTYHAHCGANFKGEADLNRLSSERRKWWCVAYAATMHVLACGHVFQSKCGTGG